MAIGEVFEVTTGNCADIYCLDVGLYETPHYGAVYLIDAAQPAVVDTGTGVNYQRLRDALASVGIPFDELEVIALTHVHLDHAGGAGLLAADCPNAEVYVHTLGARHLVDPTQLVGGTKQIIGDLWEFHRTPEPIPEDRIRSIEDGDVIDLGDYELQTVAVPGHAPHQVAFYEPNNDALFTADAAGMWLPDPALLTVTTPPPNFDLDQWLDTHHTIRGIDAGTFLYPHFGPREGGNTIDEHERILTEWVCEIAEMRESLDDDTAVIEHFLDRSALRDALGDPAGSIPTRFSVQGVMMYLDS